MKSSIVNQSAIPAELPLRINAKCAFFICSWHYVLLLFSVLSPQYGYAKINLEPLEIEDVGQYVDDCSTLSLAVCLSGFSYLEATDEIVLSLVMNNSLMNKENRKPRVNLRIGMLLHLLAFNSELAREQGIVDDFVDLGITKHDQSKVIVVGEIYSDETKYVGFYKREFDTGYLTYDIAPSNGNPVDFYIARSVEEHY